MKMDMILAVLLILIGGCSTVQDPTSGLKTISGTQDLVPNEQDLLELRMTNNGTDCTTEEYPTNERSPLAQSSTCFYTITSLNDTQVVLELQKFTNLEDLNGTYQYSSLHLRSAEGLISENEYGDQSRFYVNNENDYGGQYNDPTIYYYHLWICKDEYLIHITSSGTKDAEEYIAKIGERILSKFG